MIDHKDIGSPRPIKVGLLPYFGWADLCFDLQILHARDIRIAPLRMRRVECRIEADLVTKDIGRHRDGQLPDRPARECLDLCHTFSTMQQLDRLLITYVVIVVQNKLSICFHVVRTLVPVASGAMAQAEAARKRPCGASGEAKRGGAPRADKQEWSAKPLCYCQGSANFLREHDNPKSTDHLPAIGR